MKEIRFVRSGGFAGPATRVEGVVEFDAPGGPRVRSAAGNYSRVLSDSETKALCSLDLAAAGDLRGGRARDGFQYDITVVTEDGRKYQVTVGEQPASELDRSAPGLGALADFVRTEARAIWRAKSSSR